MGISFGNSDASNQLSTGTTGTIQLQKGQKIDLTKGNPGLKKVHIGLGWDTNKYQGQEEFDLDASVFLVGANGKVNHDEDFIFYNNLKSRNGGVIHQGDNRTGDGDGDDEVITVEFDKIPSDIEKVVITVTIYDAEKRHQNFGQVNNAYIRVVDSNTDTELLKYDLGEDFSIQTAIVVAELYKHNNEWKFNAIGSGFTDGLAALCKNYDLDV